MPSRICKICKKKFIYKHREKVCSDKCRIENKKQWSKKYFSTDKVKEKEKYTKKVIKLKILKNGNLQKRVKSGGAVIEKKIEKLFNKEKTNGELIKEKQALYID